MKSPISSPSISASNFVSYIQRIGTALEKPISQGYRDDFIMGAYEALQDREIYRLFEGTEPQAILADYRLMDIQHSTVFGDLQLTLYRSKSFYIEILYWLDGATSIHDHGFEGAFAILSGCAVQSVFGFKTTERISDGFHLGETELIETKLMTTGSVNRIEAGSRFIHSTFHITQPSVSIVIRTHRDDKSTIQLDYDTPYVAINTDAISPYTIKSIKVLAVKSRVSNDQFSRQAVECAASESSEMLYMFLNSGLWTRINEASYQEFRSTLLSRQFGRQIVVSSARREALRQAIFNRSAIQDETLKTVLGLCLCAYSVDSFIDLLDGSGISRNRCAEALLQVCGAVAGLGPGASFSDSFACYRVGSDKPSSLVGLLRDICGSGMQTIFPLIALEPAAQ